MRIQDVTQLADPSHRRLSDADRERILADLIRQNWTPLISYATRLTGGDRAWAEDIVQESFVRAWRHLDRLVSNPGSIRGWLSRVAHNVAIDGHRTAQARTTDVGLADELADEPAADHGSDVLNRIVLGRALATLPAEQRIAIVETFLRDRTAAQAAQLLGVPTGTIKSRVFYGLRQLRANLDEFAEAG